MKMDIELLAIEAAEELMRYKSGNASSFNSLNEISLLIKSQDGPSGHYPIGFLCNNAIALSKHPDVSSMNINEIVDGATDILSKKMSGKKEFASELDPLIHFFVALSDSAALHRDKLKYTNEFVL